MSETQKKSGRRQLIALMLIFFTPLLIAWLMHFDVISWRPQTIVASGELVQPPLVLPEHVPVYLVQTEEHDFLRRKWHLLYIAPGNCEKICEDSLIRMRQVRMALGKYQDRIGRVLVVQDSAQWTPQLQDGLAGMDVVTTNPVSIEVLRSTDTSPGEWIYLVDPLGNLMMRFAHDHDAREMHDDMKRLLKLSRIG